jgi:hypothetical protein
MMTRRRGLFEAPEERVVVVKRAVSEMGEAVDVD